MTLDPDSPDFTAAALGEGTPERLTAFQRAMAANFELRREAAQVRHTARLLGAALKNSSAFHPIKALPRPVPVSHKKTAVSTPRSTLFRRYPQLVPVSAAAGFTALLLGSLQWISLPAPVSEPVAKVSPDFQKPPRRPVTVNAGSAFSPASRSLPATPGLLPPSADFPALELPAGGWLAGPISPPASISVSAPKLDLPAAAPPLPAPPDVKLIESVLNQRYASPSPPR